MDQWTSELADQAFLFSPRKAPLNAQTQDRCHPAELMVLIRPEPLQCAGNVEDATLLSNVSVTDIDLPLKLHILWAGNTAQLVTCLPHKLEDMCSTSSSHVKTLSVWCTHIIPVLERWSQVTMQGSLARLMW